MFQAQRLKEAIFFAETNPSRLARDSGVHRNTIKNLMSGEGNPKASTLEALIKPLGLEAYGTRYFFERDALYKVQPSTQSPTPPAA